MKKTLIPAAILILSLCGCVSPAQYQASHEAAGEADQCTWKMVNRSVPPKSRGKRMKCVYEQASPESLLSAQ
ncbi:hypothetical protein [Bowmanella dokdonensis]|uniref:Lipoprotein n=1 Tax=Bowmanella dokdonensis TaxID=751969 RepID=A0A939DMF7_9ALTE|nr:hypothetical protein [Bowmanella dokdonensis]MBN7825468.1 hypothetical protein [Bowmanella dokdonensis]